MSLDLKKRVDELVAQHGSLRAAGRAIMVDHAYLSRLASGEKVAPTKDTLKRMGLRQTTVIVYERLPVANHPASTDQSIEGAQPK